MAKKKSEDQNGEAIDGEEPNFEDPDDFVDDITEQGNICVICILNGATGPLRTLPAWRCDELFQWESLNWRFVAIKLNLIFGVAH